MERVEEKSSISWWDQVGFHHNKVFRGAALIMQGSQKNQIYTPALFGKVCRSNTQHEQKKKKNNAIDELMIKSCLIQSNGQP